MARADNRCEVMVDQNGLAISSSRWWQRCGKLVSSDRATATNFLHVATRNGESQEWVLDPDNIIFGCAEHHYEEGRTGKHVTRCEYGETNYVPDPN